MGSILSFDSICGVNIGKQDDDELHDIKNNIQIHKDSIQELTHTVKHIQDKILINTQNQSDLSLQIKLLDSKIDNVLMIISSNRITR
jgi:hypothetical protein